MQDHGDMQIAAFHEAPHLFSPERVELKKTILNQVVALNKEALELMKTMYEDFTEDLNEDEYDEPIYVPVPQEAQ
eukprot:6291907-Prorocentrum_lima.AAC.1